MTTITRERAQEIFLGNGPEPTASEQRELARIALASLTAKPIAHTSQYGIDRMIRDNAGLLVQAHGGNAYEIPLYTTPPAPIVPDAISTRQAISKTEECEPCDSINVAYKYGWNACRATMLQANQRDLSQPVDPQVADYEKTMLQAGNSPVIPDGWALVPIVPTEDMVINGFESEPDPHFSDEKVWAEYEALSGCRRAARRAELCWAAMIKAAPKPEAGPCTK
ncbi:TPA: hypothetical protein ACXZW1_003127 [Salmonella enterica]